MGAKALKVAVEAAQVLPLDDLNFFQDNIKRLTKERYEELKAMLMELDISFCLHVWYNENRYWLIDGHQRVFTMRQMREAEGWIIPDIPVAIVQAPSFAIAKQKVLAGISVAGEVDKDKLTAYLHNYDIPVDGIFGYVHLPDFDKPKFLQTLLKLADDTSGTDYEAPTKDMQSSSAGVKQVQLFFDAGSHSEFLTLVGALSTKYKTENVTDTVLRALREANSPN